VWKRTHLSVAFDVDVDFDFNRTLTRKAAPSFASFAKGGNHEPPQRRS